jgi:aminoglycoside phosphotransferase
VKLFYGVGDRGAWSLGSKLIPKERSATPPNYEADNLEFLREKTTIPVPKVVEHWTESNGRYFTLMRRISGEPLNEVWATLSTTEKERIAKQTADYLKQLRDLC